MNYELNGGFIKNAVLSAISYAIARGGNTVEILQSDLEKGAKLQLRGHLQLVEFERRIIPNRGLDHLVAPSDLKKQLSDIISFEKAKKILFGHWGFDFKSQQATVAIFYGPSGTGKSLAAEALGYETGRPLKELNCAEISSRQLTNSQKNIDTIFRDLKSSDAILVLDNASAIFSTSISSVSRQQDLSQLVYNINKFSGLIILTCEQIEDLDLSHFKHQHFIVEFKRPTKKLQRLLWQKLLPSKTPTENIDFTEVVKKYNFTGGEIFNTIIRAAEIAALRRDVNKALKLEDLFIAADNEKRLIHQRASGAYKIMFH
eukprot:TRINITY_DN4275_c0_g1_i1.p1 TRINITY_DN4275_c0_g1~~TRINITY_DN4275_c0_g1_i1.p1  ORF type:complete len:316 (-),score=53.28 TRINITY_DN4275_c0_g1_i1:23-970(-)